MWDSICWVWAVLEGHTAPNHTVGVLSDILGRHLRRDGTLEDLETEWKTAPDPKPDLGSLLRSHPYAGAYAWSHLKTFPR